MGMPEMARMHTGELYSTIDEEILAEQGRRQDLVYEYNMLRPSETAKREELLHRMLGTCGEGVVIESPFHANLGGKHCHFGDHVYANTGLTCVDDTHIYVGEDTLIGPNVILVTAGHPLLSKLRIRALQYNAPVHIGRRCWLGAGVIVLPGVSIGDDTTIGAGSIVTKDVPAGVLALGVPCRVQREIGEHESQYYFRDREISWDDMRERYGIE